MCKLLSRMDSIRFNQPAFAVVYESPLVQALEGWRLYERSISHGLEPALAKAQTGKQAKGCSGRWNVGFQDDQSALVLDVYIYIYCKYLRFGYLTSGFQWCTYWSCQFCDLMSLKIHHFAENPDCDACIHTDTHTHTDIWTCCHAVIHIAGREIHPYIGSLRTMQTNMRIDFECFWPLLVGL